MIRYEFIKRDKGTGKAGVVAVATVEKTRVKWSGERVEDIQGMLRDMRKSIDPHSAPDLLALPDIFTGSYFWVQQTNGNGVTERGGAGSGNFGHAGRPGEVGGSAPRGSGALPHEALKPRAAGGFYIDRDKPVWLRKQFTEWINQRRKDGDFVATLFESERPVIFLNSKEAQRHIVEELRELPFERLYYFDSRTGQSYSDDGTKDSVTVDGHLATFQFRDSKVKDMMVFHNHPEEVVDIPPSTDDIFAQLKDRIPSSTIVTKNGKFVVNYSGDTFQAHLEVLHGRLFRLFEDAYDKNVGKEAMDRIRAREATFEDWAVYSLFQHEMLNTLFEPFPELTYRWIEDK